MYIEGQIIRFLMNFLDHTVRVKSYTIRVEELETNLMSLVIFITLNICSTCFEH